MGPASLFMVGGEELGGGSGGPGERGWNMSPSEMRPPL